MTRIQYVRGLLLLPLCLAASSLCARAVLGPELPADPLGSIFVYLLIGFIFGGVPYAFCIAVLWNKLAEWAPRHARMVAILLPWMWVLLAILLLNGMHGPEHAAPESRFPWRLVTLFLIWVTASISLEPLVVRKAV
jgi:hypothetical protein